MDNRVVTGKTQLCGIIGDPVEHSMSPAMHNAAFARMGLDFWYVPFRVKAEDLPQAVAGMKALNIRGLNVTIPHKVAIIPLLDELDPLAEKIGAVNTVVNDNGVLQGFNTDASGFLEALIQKGVEPKGKKVVVLGAGGLGLVGQAVERGTPTHLRLEVEAHGQGGHEAHERGRYGGGGRIKCRVQTVAIVAVSSMIYARDSISRLASCARFV